MLVLKKIRSKQIFPFSSNSFMLFYSRGVWHNPAALSEVPSRIIYALCLRVVHTWPCRSPICQNQKLQRFVCPSQHGFNCERSSLKMHGALFPSVWCSRGCKCPCPTYYPPHLSTVLQKVPNGFTCSLEETSSVGNSR